MAQPSQSKPDPTEPRDSEILRLLKQFINRLSAVTRGGDKALLEALSAITQWHATVCGSIELASSPDLMEQIKFAPSDWARCAVPDRPMIALPTSVQSSQTPAFVAWAYVPSELAGAPIDPSPAAFEQVLLLWTSDEEPVIRPEEMVSFLSDVVRILAELLPRRWRQITPVQVLTVMQPRGYERLYVLGCFDRRITFYAQQVRALTLVRAMFEREVVTRDDRIGVIGGGIAGLTAAVAAASKGCQVSVYEEKDDVLSMQASANHRFLHPHIYDWPEAHSTNTEAGLRLLNWTAGMASDVVKQIRAELDRLQQMLDARLSVDTGTAVGKIERLESAKTYRLLDNDQHVLGDFKAIIVALGFGLDESSPSLSYWTPDGLTGPFSGQKKILVSGNGDGGLTDLARATLRDFRHDEFLTRITRNDEFRTLGHRMAEIDGRLNSPRNLWAIYQNLDVPDVLLDQFSRLKRSDTDVTFNYVDEGIFTQQSSIINRLLAVLMIKLRMVKHRRGYITWEAAGTGCTVNFCHSHGESPDHTEEFDFVVARHGPSPDHFRRVLPDTGEDLINACKALAGQLADLRLTEGLDPTTLDFFHP